MTSLEIEILTKLDSRTKIKQKHAVVCVRNMIFNVQSVAARQQEYIILYYIIRFFRVQYTKTKGPHSKLEKILYYYSKINLIDWYNQTCTAQGSFFRYRM